MRLRAIEWNCRASRRQEPRNRHAARLGRHRRSRSAISASCSWSRATATETRRFGRERPLAAVHLSALARDLLHVLDVFRLGRARLAHRLRFPDDLSRPDPDDRALLAADHAHRAARQGAEHHLDRRLHRRALRQGTDRRRDRGADRDHRHHSLHRASAQSGVVLADAPSSCISARPAARCSRCWATSRSTWRWRWRSSPCCSAPAISTPPSTRTG